LHMHATEMARVACSQLLRFGGLAAVAAVVVRRLGLTSVVPVLALASLAFAYGARYARRSWRWRHRAEDLDALLQEVGQRSKGVLYIVSNKTKDQFSVVNLKKYLRMKGVEVQDGATEEETISRNARQLLQLLDTEGTTVPPKAVQLRHALVSSVIDPERLTALFPAMKAAYVQQPLDYGRNSRYGDKWRISCYLVVMENWKPKIEAHQPMVECMGPVMDACTEAFAKWFCRQRSLASVNASVMNAFVTRYRPIQDEDELKKHIDGANVDGSVILALPTDDPFQGGALHVWDGKPQRESVYHMRPGDVIFLENAVWHQAKPITTGTRWALVIFLRLKDMTPQGRA